MAPSEYCSCPPRLPLYFGCTLDFTARSCAVGGHHGQAREEHMPGGVFRAPTQVSQTGGTDPARSPDPGSRFLMIKTNGVEDVCTMPEIIIVEHWFEELKARVPVP